MKRCMEAYPQATTGLRPFRPEDLAPAHTSVKPSALASDVPLAAAAGASHQPSCSTSSPRVSAGLPAPAAPDAELRCLARSSFDRKSGCSMWRSSAV